MKKLLGLVIVLGFLFASCAADHSGLIAKKKGAGCNTRAGVAKKNAFNSIQYR